MPATDKNKHAKNKIVRQVRAAIHLYNASQNPIHLPVSKESREREAQRQRRRRRRQRRLAHNAHHAHGHGHHHRRHVRHRHGGHNDYYSESDCSDYSDSGSESESDGDNKVIPRSRISNKRQQLAAWKLHGDILAWINCSLYGAHTLHVAMWKWDDPANKKRITITKRRWCRWIYMTDQGQARFKDDTTRAMYRNQLKAGFGDRAWEAVSSLTDAVHTSKGCSICKSMPMCKRYSSDSKDKKSKVLNGLPKYERLCAGIRSASVAAGLRQAPRKKDDKAVDRFVQPRVYIINFERLKARPASDWKYVVLCVDRSDNSWKPHHYIIRRPWDWRYSESHSNTDKHEDPERKFELGKCPRCKEHFLKKPEKAK